MRIGLVLSAWTTVSGRNVPQIAIDYALDKCVDVTGQQQIAPEPNQAVFAVRADSVTAVLIESDGNYIVLTDDGITDGVLFEESAEQDSHWQNEVEDWMDNG